MRREDTIGARGYKDAGVDIDAADRLVDAIKPLAEATARPGVLGGLGGFGGLFDLKAAGYRDPVLVAATDGVGTKVKLAAAAGRHRGIGIDLVAMCVNDLAVQGAEPLFFLDYFATGRLDPAAAEQVVTGVADGCRQAGCALIGGETAEMPGMYPAGEYDLAGFAVGAVERAALLTGADVRAGDMVLGLAASGLHANGFSLVRRLLEEQGLGLDDPAPFADGRPVGEALLEPTRIYAKACLAARAAGRDGLHGFAHITGGGLLENIPRVLPGGLAAELDAAAWPVPPVFRWLQASGDLAPAEMARTFNCGIGMCVLCAPDAADSVAAALAEAGETVHAIGRIIEHGGEPSRVGIAGWEAAWRS